jgi:hypothetical protein
MNPTSGENVPQFEVNPAPEGLERKRERAIEGGPAKEAPSQKPVKIDPTTVSIPVLDAPVGAPQDSQKATGNAATADLSAQEVDRIEKQWVARAKTIVAQTQDDPYVQKKEISKAGADYIKKRFNKTIPTDDAAQA